MLYGQRRSLAGAVRPQMPYAARHRGGLCWSHLHICGLFLLPVAKKSGRRRGMNEDEGRPSGTKDIVEYIDEINEIRAKVMPLVKFLSIAVAANKDSCCVLTSKETGSIVRLLCDMLGDLFVAVDGIKSSHGDGLRPE